MLYFLLSKDTNQIQLTAIAIKSNVMKYRVDAYKNGAVRQGTKLLTDIDEAIKLAKQVATHYHCQTCIARVCD